MVTLGVAPPADLSVSFDHVAQVHELDSGVGNDACSMVVRAVVGGVVPPAILDSRRR